MNALSAKQLTKLRQLARQAYELDTEQRARAQAYQSSLSFERLQAGRIEQLEQQLEKLRGAIRSKDLAGARTEIERRKVLIDQAKTEQKELQASIARTREFLAPLQTLVDLLLKRARTSRAELGLNYGATAVRAGEVVR